MAFSTSSLTTDAGRSTTSPAAIWLARSDGRRLILLMSARPSLRARDPIRSSACGGTAPASPTVIADADADTATRTARPRRRENAAAARSCRTAPVSSVSGMKMVDTTVSTFMTSFSRLLTFERCASSMPGDPILENHRVVGDADEVVVDVAKAERHLGADRRETRGAPGGRSTSRCGVMMRRSDGDLALHRREFGAPASGPASSKIALLEFVEPLLELLDLRPVVSRPSRRRCGGSSATGPSPRIFGLRVAVFAQLLDRAANAPSWTVTR